MAELRTYTTALPGVTAVELDRDLGGWCPVCLLPSAWIVHLTLVCQAHAYAIDRGGRFTPYQPPLGMVQVTACPDCGTQREEVIR